MNPLMSILACVLLALAMLVSGCGDDSPSGTGDDGSFLRPVVVMETSLGEIEIELYRDKAPMTVMNFLKYVDDGFYDGLIFHRVIRLFIVQGGGYGEDFEPIPTCKPIRNEADNGLSNIKGTIAMGRTSDVHSATSQFFFNMVNNDGLDHRDDTDCGYGYCVFGSVIEGMGILEAFSEVETGTVGDFHDVPVEPVFIIRVIRKR